MPYEALTSTNRSALTAAAANTKESKVTNRKQVFTQKNLATGPIRVERQFKRLNIVFLIRKTLRKEVVERVEFEPTANDLKV